jgi:hypothetical protein
MNVVLAEPNSASPSILQSLVRSFLAWSNRFQFRPPRPRAFLAPATPAIY